MQPLTKKQKETLNFIKQFRIKNGYMPSLREIGKKFKLTSQSSMWHRVNMLVENGYLTKTFNQSRSIKLKIENDIIKFIVNFNPRLFHSKSGIRTLIEILKDYQKELK